MKRVLILTVLFMFIVTPLMAFEPDLSNLFLENDFLSQSQEYAVIPQSSENARDLVTLNPQQLSSIENLRIWAIFYPGTNDEFAAKFYYGGDEITSSGAIVVWGHYYASPSDVSWGSKNNPDVYVKVWITANGRIDVNFFHVSVPDVLVLSGDQARNKYLQAGTVTMNNRYSRHEYWLTP